MSKITQGEADAAYAAAQVIIRANIPDMFKSYVKDEMIFELVLVALEAAYPHRPVTPVAMKPAETK